MNEIEDDEEAENEEAVTEEFPLYDAADIAILMHREAHFGGKFEFMLEYYEHGGKGVQPEFEISRIHALHHLEQRIGTNLAPLMLLGPDAEKIAASKDAYKKLRTLYEISDKKKQSAASEYPKLIADLILAEDEEPEAEMAAIVAQKGAIIPALIHLLRSEEFHDPVYPGYGLAPALAAKCLGKIGDKRAIVALFESIGNEDFVFEELSLTALREIGDAAKEFLLKVLHSRPINYDNERAAIALLQFKDDPEVMDTCFTMLKELDLKKHTVLATYLVLACEGLKDQKSRKEFQTLAKAASTPKMLQPDFKTILQHWEQEKT